MIKENLGKGEKIRDAKQTISIDPITLAILNKRFDTVTIKMANTLLRTGRSGVLNLARDFSTSIVTRDCELLTGAESLPIHCLSGADLMSKAMIKMHPNLKRGDAFLHNSPYHGCSHPADHTILVPVIDDEGSHQFTVWVKAHQADCGNSQPTTYAGDAEDVYNEGALIFPAIKVQDDYKDVQDIIRICEMRIRVPEQWRGDFLAMIGAARVGEREILGMAEEYGWETLHTFTREWFDYSEKLMSEAIKKMPRGKSTVSTTHDPLPGTPPEGITITAGVEVDRKNAMIEVDLRDNPDTLPCGLNLSEACARTSAMIGIFNSIEDIVPTNAGSFRRIKILIREDSIAGGGKHPISMSVATTNLADRITNAVQRAFSNIKDGVGLAECGYTSSASESVISGKDSRKNDEPYVNELFLAFTAGAAAAKTDAWLTLCHAGNAGMCNIDSVELDELHFPILVSGRWLISDTEGAGRNIGAPSAYCEFGPLGGDPVVAAWVTDGAINVAKGTRGGHDGSPVRNYKKSSDGKLTELPFCSTVTIHPGETIVAYTGGGGGYGPPHERPIEKVKEDVGEGYISRERAFEIYGVVFDEKMEINQSETYKRRKVLSNKSS